MRMCTKCSQSKDESFFGKGSKRKDGTYSLHSWCKSCVSEYKKTHYVRNKDKYLEKAKRQRESDPEGYKAYLREYHQNNKEALAEKGKEYRQTTKGKETTKKAYDKYRHSELGRLKEAARNKVNKALKSGALTKPDRCEICGCLLPLEGHHEDYNKPLDVIWVCKQCHENVHHLNEGHESM